MFINEISITQILKSLISFLIYAPKLIFSTRFRYVSVTPYSFRKQYIFDKKSRSFKKFNIRNLVDYNTLNNIFTKQCYTTENIYRHEQLVGVYRKILINGKVPLIIDCGANIGLATRYFCEQWPKAHLIAIEPDLNNLEVAKTNNQIALKKIEFLNCGISCSEGKARLLNKEGANTAYQTEISDNGEISMISMNDLIRERIALGYAPFIIKIDIEGFESDLFKENLGWISESPLIILELHDWMLPFESRSKNFLKAISNEDRDFILMGENVFSLMNTVID